MARTWQKSEIAYLTRYGANRTPEELARRFETGVAEVIAQMQELGIETRSGRTSAIGDPILGLLEKALETLHRGDWESAAAQLEQLIEEVDQPEIAARALQYLAVCRDRLATKTMEDGADPFLRAVVLKNQGELDAALKIASTGPNDDDRFAYLEASIHALKEEGEKAEKALQRAVEINPKNRVYAFHDPDFTHLRERGEYEHLFRHP